MTRSRQLPPCVEGRHLPALRRELLADLRADPDLVLDCSEVTVVSPAGQALLLSLERAARRRGGQLHLDQPSSAMTLALRSTGLNHRLGQATAPRPAAAP